MNMTAASTTAENTAAKSHHHTDSAQPPSSSMIEVSGLHKQYGLTHAVNDLSFSVNRGQVVGFLGPNGAGKSTTMKMITGFLSPSQGDIKVGGITVAKNPLAAQRLIGYLPESAPMYDDMMVIDFLSYVAALRGVRSSDLKKRLPQLVQRCGLAKVLGKDISQLSKGFRQRVGIAQALIHDPELLIFDEPTSGLDPNQIVEIRELIKDLGRDKTVLLSTHILPEVQATCSRILIIADGKLVADDTPDALTEKDSGTVISLTIMPKNGTPIESQKITHVLSNLPGIHSVDPGEGEGGNTVGLRLRSQGADDPRAAIFNTLIDHDLILLDMHRERVSLEDTFRRLTHSSLTHSKEEQTNV